MPKYYHIHRGLDKSELDTKFIEGLCLFFSKKDSGWYNFEKDISKNYGGYSLYEIYIPSTRYTKSFNPTTKGKIVKITSINIKEYAELRKLYIGNIQFVDEMNKRNIIGIDATIEHKYAYIGGWPEGFVWKKPSDIKIKLIEKIKL
jgi:hypothetical protein